MVSTNYIPVTISYIVSGLTKSNTLSTKNIYYSSGKDVDTVSDADLKKVSNSTKITKALNNFKADGTCDKTAESALSGISFYLKSEVTEDMINEYLDICNQISELEEKKMVIYNKLQTEAALYFENNSDNRPDLKTENGSISATNVVSVSTDKPAKLKKILDDTQGELVKRSTSYDMTAKLKKIIGYIVTGNYDKTSIEDFAAKVNKFSSNTACENITAFMSGLKKTFDSNVKYFMGTYKLDESTAIGFARQYTRMCNYKEITQLMKSSNVNIDNPDEVNAFVESIKNIIAVKQSTRIEIN